MAKRPNLSKFYEPPPDYDGKKPLPKSFWKRVYHDYKREGQPW